jgi:hypothetical protein
MTSLNRMNDVSHVGVAVHSEVCRWRVLWLLATAFLMTVVDLTIVNVALPTIGSKLHFPESDLQWAVTAYTLAFGGFLLFGGRAAARNAALYQTPWTVLRTVPGTPNASRWATQLTAGARQIARSVQAGSVWPCFCTGEQRCRAAPDPGRILIPHQPGKCRSGDDHAGDKRRYQRVARSYGREQPAGRAGQYRGDHGDHPGDGQELLPQADPQSRGGQPFRGG